MKNVFQRSSSVISIWSLEMSWKLASASRSSSRAAASSRITSQFSSMWRTQGKRSSGKNVASPTSERLPIQRSIGARIASPTLIVSSTVRSHSVLCSIFCTSQGLTGPSLVAGRTDSGAGE